MEDISNKDRTELLWAICGGRICNNCPLGNDDQFCFLADREKIIDAYIKLFDEITITDDEWTNLINGETKDA